MIPTISVVIPLYNHQNYISQTIYSVISQKTSVREIIVIDDGSSDAGPAIVEAIAKNRPEVIFWKQRNRGAHNTINSGIQRATSDLVAVLNSDDIYDQDRFQIAADAFAADPNLDALFTTMNFIDGDGRQMGNPWFDEVFSYYKSSGDLGKTLVNGNIFVTTSNLIARRRLFDDIGMFSDLRYAHDLDFFLRLVSRERKVKIVEQPLLSYRIHQTNTISEGHLKVKLEWAAVTAFHLSRIATLPGGWEKVQSYVEILSRHNLMQPVLLLFGYFMKNSSVSLDGHPYHADEAFKGVVRGLVG